MLGPFDARVFSTGLNGIIIRRALGVVQDDGVPPTPTHPHPYLTPITVIRCFCDFKKHSYQGVEGASVIECNLTTSCINEHPRRASLCLLNEPLGRKKSQ